MKKILFVCFLLSSCVFAQDYNTKIIAPFGTLNNTDNPIVLPDHMAQDMLNVDITEHGSIKKRKGYGLAYTLDHTTSPVHGVYHFYDSSGNDVSLFFNDYDMISEITGTQTTLFSTGSFGVTYDCTDSEGYAYCVNTSTFDGLIKTDGDTYSLIHPVSTGTMITSTVERLVMAGFNAAPNRIDFSEANDFTNWTVGGDPTDPIQFTIVSPGQKITHITYAFGRVMWFKSESFGYILEGPTQADWVVRIISRNIGTLNNTSVYYNGLLYFQAQDSHFYVFDGASLTKLSSSITSFIELIQTKIDNIWTQTSQNNFSDGYVNTNIVYLDTQTISGDMKVTFPDHFSALRDGSGGTKNVWTEFNSGGHSGTVSILPEEALYIYDLGGASTGRTNLRTTELLPDFQQGTTYHINLGYIFESSIGSGDFFITLSSEATTTANPDGLDQAWVFHFESTTPAKIYLKTIANDVDGTLCADPCSNNTAQYSDLDIYISTTTYAVTYNSILVSSGTHTWSITAHMGVYVYLSAGTGSGKTIGVKIDDFQVAPSSYSYFSDVHNANNISSWNPLIVNSVDDGVNSTIYLRSHPTAFPVNSSTIAWTNSISGQIPSISTNPYFQLRYDVVTTDGGQEPALYDFTVQWKEGAASDKTYAIYFDDKIWWSVPYGDGQADNNYSLILDLINQGWVLYDIGSGGYYIKKNDLYFGDSSGGYIYQFGSAESDNGSDIEAYWKSKDYIAGSLFLEKEFTAVSVAAASQSGSNVTLTYEVDGSSSTAYSIDLEDTDSDFIKHNRNLAAGRAGQTINFKVGNDASDQPFEIFGIQFGFRSKPWRPTE